MTQKRLVRVSQLSTEGQIKFLDEYNQLHQKVLNPLGAVIGQVEQIFAQSSIVEATFIYPTGVLIYARNEKEIVKWHSVPDVKFVGKGKWAYV